MKKVLCILTIATIAVSGYAQDQTKWYVSGALGYASLMDADWSDDVDSGSISFDAGISYSLAFGAVFANSPFRAELELSGQANDIDQFTVDGIGPVLEDQDTQVTLTTFVANGYYDFDNESSFTPYIMAGLGFGQYVLDLDVDDGSSGVGVFQIGVGVGYEITEQVTIDLKYKYFMTSDPAIGVEGGDGDLDLECSGQQLLVGVRYAF